MVQALALILGLQLAGETISAALALPVPGPVLGMAALFGLLMFSGGPAESLDKVSLAFLGNLGLLFVPAGVGVSLHLGRAGQEWLALVLALLLGTAIAIVGAAWLFERIARATSRKFAETGDE